MSDGENRRDHSVLRSAARELKSDGRGIGLLIFAVLLGVFGLLTSDSHALETGIAIFFITAAIILFVGAIAARRSRKSGCR